MEDESIRQVLELVEKHFGTGCRAVCKERYEQIHKHGFDQDWDMKYKGDELVQCAMFCIDPNKHPWPDDFSETIREKILQKNYPQRLKISAALLTARIDSWVGVLTI